jgi:hypothetical protein
MTTFSGNQAVQSGYYLNTTSFAIEPIASDGARLPAGPGAWRRIPTVAALLATPFLGLAFLVFLPFIGFALTLRAAVDPIASLTHGSAGHLAATMSPGWLPGEAHLTGKRAAHDGTAEQGPAAARDEAMEALQREIDEKRQGR